MAELQSYLDPPRVKKLRVSVLVKEGRDTCCLTTSTPQTPQTSTFTAITAKATHFKIAEYGIRHLKEIIL